MEYTCSYSSPLGPITLASNGSFLTGLWFCGQKYFAATLGNHESGDFRRIPALLSAIQWLNIYFSGKEPDFLPPLQPQGSDFRQAVWNALLEIPFGETTTYGDLAKTVGCASSQAVGGAVGHNPISIIIPCHRVVGSNGSLTGYAGGIKKKVSLLQLEGAYTDKMYAPKSNLTLP